MNDHNNCHYHCYPPPPPPSVLLHSSSSLSPPHSLDATSLYVAMGLGHAAAVVAALGTAPTARTVFVTAVWSALVVAMASAQGTWSNGPGAAAADDDDHFWLAWLVSHPFLSKALLLTATASSSTSSSTTLATNHNDTTTTTTTTRKSYNWTLSTQENYRASDDRDYGKYAAIRQSIDKNFHGYYTRSRQLFQDSIIDAMLYHHYGDPHYHHHSTGNHHYHHNHHHHHRSRRRPWIVFTAGAMGAGKSHTIRVLHARGRFPLHSFVTVDPDVIRHQLPEYPEYAARCPETAGELTRNECGMIAEILTRAALRNGQNVLVDGSLRNATWYQSHFDDLRRLQPRVRIAILHVQAPREAVLERALRRAHETGRVVPRDLLERTMAQVPQSVQVLQSCVEYTAEIRNDPNVDDVELVSDKDNWEHFRSMWEEEEEEEEEVD